MVGMDCSRKLWNCLNGTISRNLKTSVVGSYHSPDFLTADEWKSILGFRATILTTCPVPLSLLASCISQPGSL